MHPDLGDKATACYPQTREERQGWGARWTEAQPRAGGSLRTAQLGASGLVDFSQIHRGLARQVGDQHFAYTQVLVPNSC